GCIPPEVMGSDPRRPVNVSLPVQIAAGERLEGKDLLFPTGITVRGRVLDPRGKPVSDAVFIGPSAQSTSDSGGDFVLHGLSPECKSYFLIVHEKRHLGGRVVIDPRDEPGKHLFEVKLTPT